MAAYTALATSDKPETELAKLEPWEIRALVIGGVGGALIGLLSTFLMIKNAERSGVKPTVGAREGLKIAVLLFGLVRNVASLWEE